MLSLILLQRLEERLPGCLDKADLLAGTSTGGIIALGLVHGVTVAELRRLYEERGPSTSLRAGKLIHMEDLGLR